MKTIFISFCLLFPSIVLGSYPGKNTFSSYLPGEGPYNFCESSNADSIMLFNIPEVVIEQNRRLYFSEDKRVTTPDSLILKAFVSSDAGQLLSMFTSAYINTTGGTGSSSILFLRGTNSYQTTVNWNGFLLNSLSLGTMDLSLIPVAAAQEISLVHGAAGSLAGSGNFGGSVSLRNSADWDNRLYLAARSELGTYDNRHFTLTGKAGNEKFQYQLLMFTQQAENNFTYNDIYKSGAPEERALNNALNSTGVLQNLFIKLPANNKVEAGMWYQERKKELPAIMGSYLPASAVQRDSSMRIYAKWNKLWARSSLSISNAMFEEVMIFRDKSFPEADRYSVDSEIKSGRFMSDVNYRIWLKDFLAFETGIEISVLSAKVDNYGNRVKETRTAAFSAFKFSIPGLVSNISLRKETDRTAGIPLLFSAGFKKALPLRGLSLKASYSDQFRIPTFNDRYWQPGGNPDLLPESGYTADIGLLHETGIGDGHIINIEVTAFNSEIRNMIQWVPSDAGSWWKPENLYYVRVTGMEGSLASAGNLGRYRYNMGVTMDYVKSMVSSGNNTGRGNHLMYVPSLTASARAGFISKRSFTGITCHFTGSRYTDTENNPLHKMPSFLTINSYAGHKINIYGVSGTIQLKVLNMLNRGYQVVRSYPMPGRTFHLGFSAEFSHK